VEELRWLEYGQRLATRRRNIAATPGSPGVGATLLRGVLDSAPRATGFDGVDDALVLDADAPALVAAQADDVAERWIFGGNRPLVREVRVGGRRVVADGRHPQRDAVAARYASTLHRLLGG